MQKSPPSVSDAARTEAKDRSRVLFFGTAFCMVLAVALALWLVFPAAAQEDPPREPQIVGGSAVSDGKYPFMASLQSDRVDTPAGHFCGGTLLDRDSILTAGHCADVIGTRDTSSSIGYQGIRIVVGHTVLTSGQGQVRRIAKFSDIKIHPRFDIRTFANDAAVIDLSAPVSGIKPVVLAPENQNALETPDRRLTIAGWGNTIAQSPADQLFGTGEVNVPNRMRQASVPVVSDLRARLAYEAVGGGYRPNIMVAAGEKGRDTCQGDSGGPLFKRAGGKTVQVGITSYGFGCANGAFPGVYAEINASQIRDFIVRAS